jgi:polygalacturonase
MYSGGPFEPAGDVTLHLEMGAMLKSSEDLADYALTRGRGQLPLIRTTNAENIAIVGRGTIDGSGTVLTDRRKTGTA